MTNSRFTHRIRYGLTIGALLLLCGCADFQAFLQHYTRHHTPAKTSSEAAADYVTNLSQANIALENGETLADISDETQAITVFTRHGRKKATHLTIAVLEYADKDGKNHKAIAPADSEDDFDAIMDVLSSLGDITYSLKEIRVLKASVSRGGPIRMKGKEEAAVRQLLADRQQSIINSAHKLSATDDARLQLALLKYFTAERRRDAAYICADNATRLLPAVQTADKAAADQLVKDLSDAEGDLHEKMPY